MPASGVAPDAMPNAIASGNATSPTVMPAIASAAASLPEYRCSAETSFGFNDMKMSRATRALYFA